MDYAWRRTIENIYNDLDKVHPAIKEELKLNPLDMKEDYETIVRRFYNDLRPKFIHVLTGKYPMLRLDEAEDLYQDAFLEVHKNIGKGSVRENTSWENYVITIGVNLASHRMRKIGQTDSIDEEASGKQSRFASFLNASTEDDTTMQDLEVQAILGNELEHSPGKCYKILRLFYFASLDMEEIAKETGLKNSGTVKVTKSRCMKDLIDRVKNAIRQAGINI